MRVSRKSELIELVNNRFFLLHLLHIFMFSGQVIMRRDRARTQFNQYNQQRQQQHWPNSVFLEFGAIRARNQHIPWVHPFSRQIMVKNSF
jgi:hypothetical protein